ncbi:unnamed protein product, partial [Adineta steineri]
MDLGCNEDERSRDAFIWGFMATSQEDCNNMTQPSYGFFNVTCCSTTK